MVSCLRVPSHTPDAEDMGLCREWPCPRDAPGLWGPQVSEDTLEEALSSAGEGTSGEGTVGKASRRRWLLT